MAVRKENGWAVACECIYCFGLVRAWRWLSVSRSSESRLKIISLGCHLNPFSQKASSPTVFDTYEMGEEAIREWKSKKSFPEEAVSASVLS